MGPSLHPFQLPPTHRLTGPTSNSHRRTIWTGRSPHRFLSPFHADATRHDRCDYPHLLDFLAAVLSFCSELSCASSHLPVLVHHLFFLLQVLSTVSLRVPTPPPCPLTDQLPIPTYPWPPFLLVPAAAYLRSVPLRRISNVRHGGAEIEASAACRLPKGVGDRQKRFGWLSHLPFLFDLPCLVAFFSPLRCDLFFLCRVSLWVALYDNLQHVLGGKRRDLGTGRKKGFRV